MKERPNIVLLTVDTLRWDAVGAYGEQRGLTPNLDRLAELGLRFDQAITGGSWTQAAFPVLLTSTYASYHGGCLGPLSVARPSGVEALARDGYQTAAFVTSPLLGRRYGYDRGFGYFAELLPDEKDPALRHVKGGERLLRKTWTHRLSAIAGKNWRPARLYVPAPEVVARSEAWIAGAQRPFFAWAHLMDVHWPYHLEERLRGPREIAQAWSDMGHLFRVNRRGATMYPEQKERYVRLYEEAVRYTDAQVGQFLDFLESTGRLKDTVVVVCSDHGEEFMERRHWGHFEVNLHDEIVRVPLIMYLPGGHGGQVITQQVSLIDLMPTLLELAGTAIPHGMEGRSLAPIWNGHGVFEETQAVSEMWRDNRHIVALRTADFKFLWDSQNPDAPRLYHLASDPDERENVAMRYPSELAAFEARVEEHLKCGATTNHGEAALAPEHDEEVLQRLHDLGYVD